MSKAQPKMTDHLTEVAAREQALHVASEAVLLKLTKGEALSADDELILNSLGWGKREIEKQTARVASMLRFRQTAGTAAERAAARAAADAAQAQLQTEGETIREQIAALESKLKQLGNAAADAEQAAFRMEEANTNLRSKVPPYIRQAYDRRIGHLSRKYADLPRLEAEIKTIDTLPGLKPNQAVDHLRAAGRHVARDVGTGERKFPEFSAAEWQSYLAEKQAERARLAAEYEPLKAAHDAEAAEASALLDYYVS